MARRRSLLSNGGRDVIAVGMSVPWGLWVLPPGEQRGLLGRIADAGIDYVFTADHVSFRDGSGMDGLVTLAAVGGLEPRLGLQVGVYLLALRHPMVAARQIATLAETAPGRLTVGVGVGGDDRHEVEVCDVDPSTRGRRTDVALAMVRALLEGRTVDGDGEFFEFRGGRIRPVPDPPVPIVVGGRSDAALERAGRLGDGWLAAWCNPRRFAQGVARVEETGARREVAWRHGLQLWLGIGASPQEGRRYVAETMERFYSMSFEPFERYTPCGTAADIAGFLQPYVDAGATALSLTPCGPDRASEIEAVAEVRRLLNP